MLLFSALVAGSFSLGGRVANEIDPMALTAVRFLLAAAFMAAMAAATGTLARRSFRAPWRYGILGATFGLYFVLMFEGLKTASPVSTAAVFTLTPILAAGFGWLILRQVTTPRMAVALAIGGTGALWAIFRADLAALLAFRVGEGEAIYFVGCIAHAFYIPVVRRLNRGEPVFAFTFGVMLAGAVVVGALGWNRIAATDWASLPVLVWVVLAYLVIFASGASISLLQVASMRLKAAKVMAYTYLTPAFVILWELALGGTPPSPLILVGIALTKVALAILLREDAVMRRPDPA